MLGRALETSADTSARLLKVMSLARVTWHSAVYAFRPVAATSAQALWAEALGFSRWGAEWSALLPVGPGDDPQVERNAVFSCTFDTGLDNSGFVGWLATLLKTRLGTGVAVVCGYSVKAGGIYDHWCVPAELRPEVDALLTSLSNSGPSSWRADRTIRDRRCSGNRTGG